MGNFKKTIDLGGMTISVEVKENTPNRSCGCSAPWQRPVAQPRCVAPNREPDGFDAHIDRPRREMYGGWDAEWGYQNDLKKYRAAEKAVKACTWPTREPMGNVQWPVPQHAAPQRSLNTPCGCTTTASRYSYPTPQPQREVRQKCGIPPIGAKVVAHRWGEPVFDR